MNRTGETMTAVFSRVSCAREFFEHITKDDGKGWNMRDVARKGRTVTWVCTKDDDGYHLSDLLETVGSFGVSPDGTLHATLNGLRARPEY